MQNLYICEKPSQARDLAKVLNIHNKHEGYISSANEDTCVTWCMGHLLEMFMPDDYDPSYKKWCIETLPIVPTTWKYNVKSSCKTQLSIITKLIKQTNLVTIATDYDREGEAIARSILERVKYKGNIQRLCLTALDDASIRKALNHIKQGSETVNMYKAALARARADWLVGMNFSRLFTCLARTSQGKDVISIGRVMTPTISLVVDRDNEIENFKPIPYYELLATLNYNDANNTTYQAKWFPHEDLLDPNGYMTNRPQVETIYNNVSQAPFTVQKYKCADSKTNPPMPFDLNSLQQYCNKTFGFSAKKTLEIAQSLYEKHKATTYPRTDCRYLPESLISEINDTVNALVSIDPNVNQMLTGANLSLVSSCFNTSKITAHHAIIPTSNPSVNINSMSADEFKVYREVRRAYIAQFYPAAIYKVANIELLAAEQLFKATSKTLVFPGWRVLFMSDKDIKTQANNTQPTNQQTSTPNSANSPDGIVNKVALPPCQKGDIHILVNLEIQDKETTPPSHFTEATLLSAMEKISKFVKEEQWKKKLKETDGIGTPATRAEIINNSIQRNFLERDGKYILSTPKSRTLMPYLPEALKSAGTTARWEQILEDVSKGIYTEDFLIEKIVAWMSRIIGEQAGKTIQVISAPNSSSVATAPKKRQYTRKTRKPRSTKQNSTATNTSNTPSNIDNSISITNSNTVLCPKCNAPMILRKGPKGEFYGCSNYPKCRGTKPKE